MKYTLLACFGPLVLPTLQCVRLRNAHEKYGFSCVLGWQLLVHGQLWLWYRRTHRLGLEVRPRRRYLRYVFLPERPSLALAVLREAELVQPKEPHTIFH